MGKKVFANGMEIAHKSGDAKVMAAFPDVCLSPPPPPTGPVPVPYPNTSFAKDLKEGSSTVKIGKKPLALRGQSYYKTSPLGDEAATRNFGGSIITHTITGKTYFQAFSMNVEVEGKNVCRHLDITTSNHASMPGSTPPMTNAETMSPPSAEEDETKCPCCKGEKHANQKGAEKISEADWYGPDGHAVALEARAAGCGCVPPEADKECGTYYKQTAAAKSQKARVRWNYRYKQDFINRWNLAGKQPPLIWEPDPKKAGDPIAHRTPISAGGCIKGDGNLMPIRAMSAKCRELDAKLTDHHTARAAHFQGP
jgi:uncharacterized Zn-binding protein involved in type VI secretion